METVIQQSLQGILLLLQQRQNTPKEKRKETMQQTTNGIPFITLYSFAVHLETPLKKCIRSEQHNFDINWRDTIKKCFPLLHCSRIVNDAQNTFKSLMKIDTCVIYTSHQMSDSLLWFFVICQTKHHVSSCSFTLLHAYGQEIVRGHK